MFGSGFFAWQNKASGLTKTTGWHKFRYGILEEKRRIRYVCKISILRFMDYCKQGNRKRLYTKNNAALFKILWKYLGHKLNGLTWPDFLFPAVSSNKSVCFALAKSNSTWRSDCFSIITSTIETWHFDSLVQRYYTIRF